MAFVECDVLSFDCDKIRNSANRILALIKLIILLFTLLTVQGFCIVYSMTEQKRGDHFDVRHFLN
jgi:type IV secretory pathway component VirB8